MHLRELKNTWSTGTTIKDTRTKSRGRVEVGEGGGFSWGGVQGWGEKAYNCNWITIKIFKKNTWSLTAEDFKTPFSVQIKLVDRCPGWCGSVDWVPACEPKSCWFGSQSGPGLQARSPVGEAQEAATHWCFSPSLSSSLLLSLEINKIF